MAEPKKFDPAEYLDDSESQTELLMDALASGNAAYLANALNVIARARSANSWLPVRAEDFAKHGRINEGEVQEGLSPSCEK